MSIAARAQDSNGDVFGGAIGKELVQMMDSAGIPGISIAIIRHHKLPYKSKVRHPKTDKTKRTTKPPTTVYNLTTTNTNSDTFHRTTIKNFAFEI